MMPIYELMFMLLILQPAMSDEEEMRQRLSDAARKMSTVLRERVYAAPCYAADTR